MGRGLFSSFRRLLHRHMPHELCLLRVLCFPAAKNLAGLP